jgi:hypothetical protein
MTGATLAVGGPFLTPRSAGWLSDGGRGRTRRGRLRHNRRRGGHDFRFGQCHGGRYGPRRRGGGRHDPRQSAWQVTHHRVEGRVGGGLPNRYEVSRCRSWSPAACRQTQECGDGQDAGGCAAVHAVLEFMLGPVRRDTGLNRIAKS